MSMLAFRPEKFMMTIFANPMSESGKETQLRLWNREIPGYRRVNLQFLRLQVRICVEEPQLLWVLLSSP